MTSTAPPDLSIDRRLLTVSLLVMFLLTWLPVGGFVLRVFADDLGRDPSLFEGVKFGAYLCFFSGLVGFVVHYCLCRSVCRARFGEVILLETLSRRRQACWAEVARLVLKEQATPIPTACVLKFVLADGARFDLFASRDQAEAVFREALDRPLAGQWPGMPLWSGTVLSVFGLGLVALLTGLWIDAIVLLDVWQRGAAALAAPGSRPGIGKLAAVGVGIPVLGLASVGFALYHLVRKPVVIRGGLVRIRAGQATSPREMLQNLFGTQE